MKNMILIRSIISIRCGGREKVKIEIVFIIQNKYE